jgi:hypothetical protein
MNWIKKGFKYHREGFIIEPQGKKFVLSWKDATGQLQTKESEGWKQKDFEDLKAYADAL